MRKSKFPIALALILCAPLFLISQTTGPSQPEVQSFQPVSITNMVDKATGQFQYNIPLFTIGGYPVNINYNSRITMDQEASMVGLGFNLNCGVITRQMRGVPDDFNGDVIEKRVNMKPNITTGLNTGISFELVGFERKKGQNPQQQVGLNVKSGSGIFYNNYTGWGIESTFGTGFHGNCDGLSGNAGIGITSNSSHGTNVNPYFGFSVSYESLQDEAKRKSKTEKRGYDFNVLKNFSDGGSYGFNSISYQPKIDLPFTSTTTDFTFKIGYSFAYIDAGGDIKGYRSVQQLSTNKVQNPAYGYLYAQNGKDIENAVMDFNRENEGIVSETKPNLPLAYGTPDVFAVVGQGLSGEFEIKRNNAFIAFDPKMATNSLNQGAEVDLGFGAAAAHIGAAICMSYTENNSGKWQANTNEILKKIDFIHPGTASSNNLLTAEQAYFVNPSDVMFTDNPLYNFSKNEPVAPVLNDAPFYGGKTLNSILRGKNINYSTANTFPSTFANGNRAPRLDCIYYLTAQEASLYGVQKSITSYTLGNFGGTSVNTLNRVDAIKKPNHLSELICLKADGSRYVYNFPVYNNYQREVTYSINELTDFANYETNHNSPDIQTPINGGKGKDDFISVTETPSYAHSYLLGCVLSPNYIDVDDNGPSEDDIGDYVKFNYSRVYSDYYWRSNNNTQKANASYGRLADKNDGKAFYSEGSKEIVYLHSIESKNEVARFYYSDRTDAVDLKNSSQPLKKLDSIFVYTRPELQTLNPQPFKRIYLSYYAGNPLCYNPASGKGKLTLESVSFKDGSSNKGKYSAYTFKYDFANSNPDYNSLATDKWGNFKKANNSTDGIILDNRQFPFVGQLSKSDNDKNAASWLLKEISTPSGGDIKIDYESHDYSYVQFKKAMSMFKVAGITGNVNPVIGDLGNNILYNGSSTYDVILFKLRKPIPFGAANPDKIVEEKYFTDRNDGSYGTIVGNNNFGNLYGKFRVELKPSKGYDKEDIPAFLDAESCGVVTNGNNDYEYGYVKLRKTYTRFKSNLNANQISKKAWEFAGQNYPNLVMGMGEDPSVSTAAFKTLAAIMQPAIGPVKAILNTGPNDELKRMDVADRIDLDQSYIRLYEEDGVKYGGSGARVKSISINDNWNTMTNGTAQSSNYNIVYEYKKIVGKDTISSGVASYEPEMGSEENPWKQPILYKDKNPLMPVTNNYLMTPLGESLFPNASVIYSEVKETKNPVAASNMQGAGFSIDKFYTAYDFPSLTYQTDIERVADPKFKLSLLQNLSNHYMASTQGYSVVTNDMHGKPKSEETFNEGGGLIMGKYYKYKVNSKGELDSKVKAIQKDNSISQKELGVDVQIYGDAVRNSTITFTGELHGNLDAQTWGAIPTAAPSIWPNLAFERKAFSYMSVTKHIRQHGILDSIIVIDKGSTVYTTNELWDASTGAVLLTKTINEFKDPVYNFTYPAHWAYSGMGLASDNIGTTALTQFPSSLALFSSTLNRGDVIAANNNKYVVTAATASNFTAIPVYASGPALNTANTTLKIISSGKRNLATTPIATFTSLKNPIGIINGTPRLNVTASTEVLDAAATEYESAITVGCNSCTTKNTKPNTNGVAQPVSPVINNTSLIYLAPWQQVATYKFIEGRNQTSTNPIIRKDGSITQFAPFWNNQPLGQPAWIKITNPLWQYTTRLSYIDKKANPVESYNPLLIFNSGQPSNIHGLTYAVANNARYFENFFESFEELRDSCATNHFQLPVFNTALVDNTVAHTGYYSIKTPVTGYVHNFPPTGLNGKLVESTNLIKECDALPSLSLIPGKHYIFSAWAKQRNATNTTLDYTQANVTISPTANGNITAAPQGQIIDGWQRIEKEFIAPPFNSAGLFNGLTISFAPNCNYDDIRIYPADGNMKSYVYSYKDYSLMAILDENNFATFYEYDQQKQLKRVKKETEKGIVTIQEVNFGSFKQ